MRTVIALIRGINVGGKHKLPMAALRALCERLGYARVRTYIQSGNVLLDTEQTSSEVERLLADAIEAAVGFRPEVMALTAEELAAILRDMPFLQSEIAAAAAAAPEVETCYITLFARAPLDDEAAKIPAADAAGNRYALVGRAHYALLVQSIRDAKGMAAALKLPIPATTRNLNTWRQLDKMARQED